MFLFFVGFREWCSTTKKRFFEKLLWRRVCDTCKCALDVKSTILRWFGVSVKSHGVCITCMAERLALHKKQISQMKAQQQVAPMGEAAALWLTPERLAFYRSDKCIELTAERMLAAISDQLSADS